MHLEEFKKIQTLIKVRSPVSVIVLEAAFFLILQRMGEPLKWRCKVFMEALVGTPADKDLTKAEILVCHGEADSFVPKSRS